MFETWYPTKRVIFTLLINYKLSKKNSAHSTGWLDSQVLQKGRNQGIKIS
jgi:hypothetical protein